MKDREYFHFYLVLLLLLVILTACSGISNSEHVFVDINNLPYFMDDFSDHSNGWHLFAEPSGVIQYDGNSLRAYLPVNDMEVITTPGISLRNSVVDVDAEKVSGPDNNYFGVVCRYQDADNYYGFIISADGYFAIIKNIAGNRTILSDGTLQPAQSIYQGIATNHLKSICQERTLKWVVNGETLAEVQDVDLIYGQVGLIAGAIDEPGVDIRYNRFIVIKLE